MEKYPAIEWLPWARFNLHRNPFGELTTDERSELAVVQVDYLIEMIREPKCAVQFCRRMWSWKDDKDVEIAISLTRVELYLHS